MNIVHNCLDKWMGTATEHQAAVRWEGEEGATRTLTYRELRQDVHRCANGLRRMGIGRGDRVALFMPMCPELIAAFFGVIAIGGVVLPLFSGYGADAVASRVQDAGAKAIDHRGRLLAARADRRDEGHRRSGGRGFAVGAARHRRVTARRRDHDDQPRLPMVGSRRLGVRDV